MTGISATGTHIGPYNQLLAVLEKSHVNHPQLEPHQAADGPSTAVARSLQR